MHLTCRRSEAMLEKVKQKAKEEDLGNVAYEAGVLAELDAAHLGLYWDFCHGRHPELTTQEALSPDVASKGDVQLIHPEKLRDFSLGCLVQKKQKEEVTKKRKQEVEEKKESEEGKKPRCAQPTKRLRSKSSGVSSLTISTANITFPSM